MQNPKAKALIVDNATGDTTTMHEIPHVLTGTRDARVAGSGNPVYLNIRGCSTQAGDAGAGKLAGKNRKTVRHLGF